MANSFTLRILFLLALLPFFLPAQNSDSLAVSAYSLAPDSLNAFTIPVSPDTSLSHIHRYDLPAFRQTQGNSGRPSQSLLLDFIPTIRPAFYHPSLNTARISLNSVTCLKSLTPYTRLNYVQGANKEQQFTINHYQKIYQNFSGTLLFKTLKSPGPYTRQKTNNSNFFINLTYATQNSRYTAHLSYLHNILKIEENGGIQNDSLVEFKTETNMRVIPVNLSNAQSRFRENQYFLQQDIRLAQTSDSTHSLLKSTLPLHLCLVSILGNEAYIYEDPDGMSGFYPVFPADSGEILDSVRTRTIRNIIRLSNDPPEDFPLNYHVGLEHAYTEIRFPAYRNAIHRSFQPLAGIRMKLPLKLILEANGIASLEPDSDDSQTYGQLNIRLSHSFSPKAGIQVFHHQVKSRANAFDTYYQSSLFSWNHDLLPVLYRETGVKAAYNWINLGFRSFVLNHAVYYLPEIAHPWQSTTEIKGIHAFAGLKLNFGPVSFDQEIHYQKLNTEAVVHLPEILSNHQLSLEIMMFKKALVFHPGIEFTYIRGYYADRYQPATQTFYYQNDTKIKDQVYLDFFINLRISRARIFLKYEHLNDRFATQGSFSAPSYPAAPAAFKFGIDWVLRK